MKILKLLMRVAMCSLLASASAVFAQAATVFELTGTATAAVIPAAAPGAPAAPAPVGRALRKGDAVNQGETITTGAQSSIVLRFSDGQVTALSANSSMAINNYTYNAAEPVKSNMLLSLLNGGMRAVTGLIGKARPENVSYRAGNATIGIRGTDVVLLFNGKFVLVQVIAGNISFSVDGKTVTVPAGKGTTIDVSNPAAPVVVVDYNTLLGALNSATDKTLKETLGFLISPAMTNVFRNTQAGGRQGLSTNTTLIADPIGQLFTRGTTTGSGVRADQLPNCNLVVSPVRSGDGQNCQN